ncbi:MarR family winged helix-turn-helix transcriptional regulator [Paenibacillus favisporus]|uniref:MarR family winged helix-turn-helix transcriptional regulator n=1 Tax=Paenibacillus favisporus TaxID=221028 RepID=UPI0013D77205|nr:MarR family transcriptional regulator [Paenibacillus favisporus]
MTKGNWLDILIHNQLPIGGGKMKLPIKKEITPKAYIYGSIFSLSNRLQLLGDRRYKELSLKQAFVLWNISLFDDYFLNLKDIAHMVGTSSQNVKKIINILEKKGFVKVGKDETDRRSLRVALTAKGKLYYLERGKKEEQYLDELFADFDDEMLMGLYRGLNKLMEKTAQEQGGK